MMIGGAGGTTGLTPETLGEYLRSGAPADLRIGTDPVCYLGIDPQRHELSLRTPATGDDIDVSGYKMITTEIFEEIGEERVWFRIVIAADGVEYEAYSILRSVADELHGGADIGSALEIALKSYKGLLTKTPRMSREQEVGLFGELLILNRLIDESGESGALDAWLGPESEEHDFVLRDEDLEVKTTTGDRRTHIIHGAGQLLPTGERPLRLVSVQLTGAGAADDGRSLVDLVMSTRKRLGRGRRAFDERLASLGWRDEDADSLYPDKFLLRSDPAVYDVDSDFPAIVPEGLSRILARPELVTGLSYTIDITDIEPAHPGRGE